jgi:hypothetical protein
VIRTSVFAVVALGLAVLDGAGCPAAAAGVREVEIVGTAFRITLADGRVLAGRDLVGAVLEAEDEAGAPLTVRIDGVEPDPLDPAGETVLYELSSPDPAAGGWADACGPDPDGRRLGFPLAGIWTEGGEHLPAPGRFSITCTSGVIGKYVRFGYKPWRDGPDGRPIWDLHQTCVRLMRADGLPRTRDGTPIVIHGRLGIQDDELGAAGFTFEAAWGPAGARCVRRTRLAGVLGLDRLAATCSGLAARTGPSCTEDEPALLYNRSPGR